jgi:hypothetical protein
VSLQYIKPGDWVGCQFQKLLQDLILYNCDQQTSRNDLRTYIQLRTCVVEVVVGTVMRICRTGAIVNTGTAGPTRPAMLT